MNWLSLGSDNSMRIIPMRSPFYFALIFQPWQLPRITDSYQISSFACGDCSQFARWRRGPFRASFWLETCSYLDFRWAGQKLQQSRGGEGAKKCGVVVLAFFCMWRRSIPSVTHAPNSSTPELLPSKQPW